MVKFPSGSAEATSWALFLSRCQASPSAQIRRTPICRIGRIRRTAPSTLESKHSRPKTPDTYLSALINTFCKLRIVHFYFFPPHPASFRFTVVIGLH